MERAKASEALTDAAGRLVSAVNEKRMTELAVLLPEALAGDLGRRERFIKLVKDFGPRATLGAIEAIALAEASGEARFTVTFNWRGDFGVDRRKAGRLLGSVRREDAGWRFVGARLLDAVP